MVETEPKKIDWKSVVIFFVIFNIMASGSALPPRLFSPFKHGYFVEDMSIRLPYVSSLLNDNILLITMTICGKIAFTVAEYLNSKPYHQVKRHLFKNTFIKEWTFQSAYINLYFLFTAFCMLLVVNVGKVMVGRLAPNFYEVCRPIPSDALTNITGYVSSYTCANTNESQVAEATSSFPSRNTAMIVYGVTFICLYLSKRLKGRTPRLVLELVLTCFVLIAWCLSIWFFRQNWAHMSDVVAGAILGVIFAVAVSTTYLNLFDYTTLKEKEKNEDENTITSMVTTSSVAV